MTIMALLLIYRKISLRKPADTMLLYTNQPLSVWHQIQLFGHYYANPNNTDVMSNLDPSWHKAYNYMTLQLERHIKRPRPATIPIWWWPVTPSRFSELRRLSSDTVVIIADIPFNQYLASNFELWHYALNRFYLHDNLYESEQSWEKIESHFQTLSQTKQRHLMIQSWHRMFIDFDPINQLNTQFVTWDIDYHQVQAVINDHSHLIYHNPQAIRKEPFSWTSLLTSIPCLNKLLLLPTTTSLKTH